ncbi:MAG: aminoacyl-tRNA hydrolase [Candidatus Spechtbacterales bacterium]
MDKNNILIVGLGNPGEKYENTPHNAGFLVIDQLIAIYDLRPAVNAKLKSEIAEHKIAGKKIVLAKPQTFMNKSGEAVKPLTTNYKLLVTKNLWLIHDDVDLELGKIKIVKNRGSAGHKGVEDIIKKLKTKDFARFRVGTRPKRLAQKRSKALMNKFVSSPVGGPERPLFKKAIKTCAEAVALSLEEGIEKSSSIYNQ